MIRNFNDWSLNEGKEIPYMAKEKLMKIIDDATSDEPTKKSFVNAFENIFKWEAENDVHSVWELDEVAEIVMPFQQHFHEFGNLPQNSPIVQEIVELFRKIKGYEPGKPKPNVPPKPKGYDEMTKKEIQDLIDQALDVRDFEKVKKLAPYLSEEECAAVMEKLKLLEESEKNQE